MQDDTFLTKEQKKELKREKAEKRNQVIAYVFAVLLFGGYALWSLGFGIYGLFMAEHLELSKLGSDVKMYTFYEGDLGAISDLSDGGKVWFCCDLEHTISGLIPYAHEYFYLIMMDDLHKVVPVRAGKHWGERLGGSASVSSIPIKGQIRKMGSFEVEKFLNNIVENNSDFFAGYQVETDYYIDLTGIKMNVLHIVVGIGLLIVMIESMTYFAKDKRKKSDIGKKETWIEKSPFPELIIVLFFATACLAVYMLSVG